MRTGAKITAAVLGAAALFGLSGAASIANAAPAAIVATSGDTYDDDTFDDDTMSTQGTRAFWISNASGRTLTLASAWGTTGWPTTTRTGLVVGDSVPLGQSVKPGQTARIEVTDWSNHGISMTFNDDRGPAVGINTHVSGLTRYSSGTSNYGQVLAGGQNITITDRAGSETVVPATDRQQQSELANELCGQDGAACTFKPTSFEQTRMVAGELVEVLGEPRFVGHALLNRSSSKQGLGFDMSDKVGVSSSLEVSAGVKAGLEGFASAEVWSTFKTEWTSEHTFTQRVDVTVKPWMAGWVTVQEPVKRFTGDVRITFHNTTIVLKDVVFDTPDPRYQGKLLVNERPLTDKERSGSSSVTSPQVAAAGGAEHSEVVNP